MKFVKVSSIVLGFMCKHPAASFVNAADTLHHQQEEVIVSSEIPHHQEQAQVSSVSIEWYRTNLKCLSYICILHLVQFLISTTIRKD
jgi:hypothetical protein